MKKVLFICSLIFFLSCSKRNETEFSQKALEDTFISMDGVSLTFKDVIKKYKGKKVVIDVWATWCRDCIKGMPKIVQLQNDFPDVVFLFLSIDNSLEVLQKGIKKYNVNGEHYLMPSGWDGEFGEFLDLSWIPRYLVIDEQGEIVVFNAIKANDIRILSALEQ
ncbi:TlpA disulfide reductase family protein [Tenacibaculum sp. 190524A05c]|uniref:TlpA family protein disulfide reductase n=1 Tax=Tenacibaculum platacis TaxID=3137852 RepID=UPI0032B2E56E